MVHNEADILLFVNLLPFFPIFPEALKSLKVLTIEQGIILATSKSFEDGFEFCLYHGMIKITVYTPVIC